MQVFTRIAIYLAIIACTGWLVGCDETQQTNPPPRGTPPAPRGATDWTKDHWTKAVPAKPDPKKTTPTIDPRPRYGRTARRISVKNLRRVIPALFPGLDWTETDRNKKIINQFERFALTLGEADYVNQYQSHANPTPLFMKFMDDMAGKLCIDAVNSDMPEKGSDGNYKYNEISKRMVVRYERDPNQNLRYLRLKFHSIYVPADSQEGIKKLRKLYDEALMKMSDSKQAWQAVCSAMIASPEFFTY